MFWSLSGESSRTCPYLGGAACLTACVEEVERELADVRKAIGSGIDVSTFTKEALLAHGAVVAQNGVVKVDLAEIPRGLRDALTVDRHLLVRFEPPTKAGELLLTRTHPIVEGLASFLLDTALDSELDSVARRCGTIRTRAVTRRTTVLLLRLRYHIITRQGDQEHPLLAEDCMTVAFEGSPANPTWLDRSSAEALLATTPDANIQPDQAAEFIRKVNHDFELLTPRLNEIARERGEELLAAHTRVRTAARLSGVRHRVEAQLPPDVLGVFVYLPALAEAGKGATQ